MVLYVTTQHLYAWQIRVTLRFIWLLSGSPPRLLGRSFESFALGLQIVPTWELGLRSRLSFRYGGGERLENRKIEIWMNSDSDEGFGFSTYFLSCTNSLHPTPLSISYPLHHLRLSVHIYRGRKRRGGDFTL